jgi:hypothetical protein
MGTREPAASADCASEVQIGLECLGGLALVIAAALYNKSDLRLIHFTAELSDK